MTSKSRHAVNVQTLQRSGIATQGQPLEVVGSGSGSGSRKYKASVQHYKFFPADQLVPLALNLRLDTPIEVGNSAAGGRLSRTAQLIYAQDSKFPGSWFSRAIKLGGASGQPAYWMLQKTAINTWLLRLRLGKGEVAAYRLKTANKHSFPIKLKKSRTTKELGQWPATITVSV